MINRTLAIALGVMLAFASLASAQPSWTPLTHQPTFNAGQALLLTDGTVIVQQLDSGTLDGTPNWWRLTPDSSGSYLNGTWSAIASTAPGYGPLYFASAVLPDGRVVIEGGEYNPYTPMDNESAQGAIYDPVANTWTLIAPPAGVAHIGDASSVVLPNGTFMLGIYNQTADYLLNATALTWTAAGTTGKADVNSEEGWTLLPNGKLLTVDTQNGLNSELYNPATGTWTSAGSTIVMLPGGPPGFVPEIGPAILRPDGTVFATGATSNNSVYNSATGTWSHNTSYDSPTGLGVQDGPAALLPNGKVLVGVCPGFNPPTTYYEFDGTSLNATGVAPPNAPSFRCFQTRMLLLPTGQVMLTDGSLDVEIYTPTGTYSSAWQPTINAFPSLLAPGSVNNAISGWQFNGLSQAVMYGDDSQAATNYPLVRITNSTTGHVFYAKTHNHSTMGVATGSTLVSTQFDVPTGIETGSSTLVVVANGIPSGPVTVLVSSSAQPPQGVAWAVPASQTKFHLRNASGGTLNVTLKTAIDDPITGDWNGDHVYSTGGCVRSTSTFNLRNANTDGTASVTFVFGTPGSNWKPIAGDWNGDGVDTVGLYDPATGTFRLRNSNTTGAADVTFTFTGAASTWLPIAGDWDGDGTTTVGLYDPATSTFYLRNSNTTGGADLTFVFGTPGAGLVPVAGDWDGNGADSIGVWNPSTFLFQLKNVNASGAADSSFTFGAAGAVVMAGAWGF